MKTAAGPNSQAQQGKFPWGRLVFLGLVAALAIACSSQSPEPVDAGAADTTPSPEQEACESAKEPCRAFVWQGGQCVAKVLVGAVCGANAGFCTVGVCDEAGECKGKQPAAVGKVCSVMGPTACQKGLGRCDASGGCVAEVFVGAKCKVGEGSCGEGTCNDQGQCVGGPAQGTICQLNDGPCGKGICNAQGKCSSAVVGQACTAKVGPCEVGLCDASGNCAAQKLPEASTCTVVSPKSCESTSGKCDAAAKCVADPAVGAACLVAGNPCTPGICNDKGGCDGTDFAAAGTSCGPNIGCGVPTCDGKGGCLGESALVGKTCSGKSPITCSKHTCNAAGQCVVGPATGEVCNSSKTGAPYCFLEATPECKQPVCAAKLGYFDLAPAPGKSCKATSACTVGVCDAGGACTQVPGNEGGACPLPEAVSAECAVGVCKAGSCAIAVKPGAVCGVEPCKAGTCDPKGACVQVPTPGKVCGPEGLCTAQICSAFGTCAEVATPGKSCPGKTACIDGVCNSAGTCSQVPKKTGASCQTIGLCGNGVCNSTGGCVDPAWPDPPACMVEQAGVFSECWTGAKDGQGGCKKVAKVGASCGCWVSPCSIGTCQADGSCLQKPNKPVGSACSSACVAAGTCDAAGLCAGPVTLGAACTPYADSDWSPVKYDCASYSCKPDGTCAASPKPAGSPCAPGYAYVSKPGLEPCGAWNSCDGKGRCVAEKSPWGNNCGGGDPCSLSQECVLGQCLTRGQDPDGAPCGKGCFSGTCTAGMCGMPGDLDDAMCGTDNVCLTKHCCGPFGVPSLTGSIDECTYEGTGSCLSKNHTGKPCGDSADPCTVGTCLQEGFCHSGKVYFSEKCSSSDPCDDHYCLNGQCVSDTQYFPSIVGGCDDGNPCTIDYAWGNCLCYHVSPSTDGNYCAPGAHCLKGNCVPD